MEANIELIVGLGNQGPEYDKTRHNAGAWLVEKLADDNGATFKTDDKFKGLACQLILAGKSCRLLLPTTFMNHSGQAVTSIARFYKIPAESILVVHDEIDLPAGTARLKADGGHGGHNGLRDIINHLGTKKFYRLRLGVGHPGTSSQVIDYVLSRPSKSDKTLILASIDQAMHVLPTLLEGDAQKAIRELHSALP